MHLSTLPLTDAALKLPNARTMRSLKRIGIVQSIQMFHTCRENAVALRNYPQCPEAARKWAAMAREEWGRIRKWLFA